MTKILITGAGGFIGSRLLYRLADTENDITAFVRDTNQYYKERWNNQLITKALKQNQIRIVKGDLNSDISGLCEGIDFVFHLAAKTYVDHSIRDPLSFTKSNTVGTANLLEEARRQKVKAFVHISTDEVYGQILEGYYKEDSPINPRNPYAASKAAADALTISYTHTYPELWTAVTRTENNYGPQQHKQKVIPTFVKHLLENKPMPIYGDGQHVRQWLHVDDHVEALTKILENWRSLPSGEVWHIAGKFELTNDKLADIVYNKLRDLCDNMLPVTYKTYIDDMNIRPGHDRRYALDCDKIFKHIGWKPQIDTIQGIEEAVTWYYKNQSWLA